MVNCSCCGARNASANVSWREFGTGKMCQVDLTRSSVVAILRILLTTAAHTGKLCNLERSGIDLLTPRKPPRRPCLLPANLLHRRSSATQASSILEVRGDTHLTHSGHVLYCSAEEIGTRLPAFHECSRACIPGVCRRSLVQLHNQDGDILQWEPTISRALQSRAARLFQNSFVLASARSVTVVPYTP